MFEKSQERQASKKFYNKCSENSSSQIVFRTDIFPKIAVGYPWSVSKVKKLECTYMNTEKECAWIRVHVMKFKRENGESNGQFNYKFLFDGGRPSV